MHRDRLWIAFHALSAQTVSISLTGTFERTPQRQSRAETLRSLFSSRVSGGKTHWFRRQTIRPTEPPSFSRLCVPRFQNTLAVHSWPQTVWPCRLSRLTHRQIFEVWTYCILWWHLLSWRFAIHLCSNKMTRMLLSEWEASATAQWKSE